MKSRENLSTPLFSQLSTPFLQKFSEPSPLSVNCGKLQPPPPLGKGGPSYVVGEVKNSSLLILLFLLFSESGQGPFNSQRFRFYGHLKVYSQNQRRQKYRTSHSITSIALTSHYAENNFVPLRRKFFFKGEGVKSPISSLFTIPSPQGVGVASSLN